MLFVEIYCNFQEMLCFLFAKRNVSGKESKQSSGTFRNIPLGQGIFKFNEVFDRSVEAALYYMV